MLRELRIRDLAVIERAVVPFDRGLNVLSGETGAGKSILVDAILLVSGGRAQTDAIRTDAETAVVEATYAVEGDGGVARVLEEAGLRVEDGHVVIRRELSRSGRHRAFLNDSPVTVGLLERVGAELVEVHGQHEHQRLLEPARQLFLLDRFAEAESLREAVAARFADDRAAREDLERLRAVERDRAQRQDLLRFQVSELDGARLRAGEEEELRLERRRLQHAVRLVSGLDDVTSWLRDDPESATARLVRATRLLGDLARLDPECAGAVETLETAHAQLEDAWHLLRGLRERIVDEPGRLEAIDERLDALTRLKRKYGDTEDAMLVFRATAAEELQRLERYEEALVEAERAREERRARLLEDAMLLSERRLAAVRTLGEAVQRELRTLGMEQARFEIAVERGDAAACSASGIDRVEFRFSANLGEELRPLARIASGGELSRVMLALQTVVAGGRVPTMIFDEVDAGVGGRVAGVVGQKLAGLAGDRQVLCVTHWPQIAAHATRHLRVIKGVRGGRTRATVTVLDDAERIEELARMLGGGAPSEAARRHASELVARARQGVRTSRLYNDGRC